MYLFYTLNILTVFYFGITICGDLPEQRILEDLANSCPFTKLCGQGEPARQEPGEEPCCNQCSCDEDCTLHQNCCPFFTLNTTTTQNPDNTELATSPPQQCIFPALNPFLDDLARFRDNVYGLGTYMAVTKCPKNNYDNDETTRLCERGLAETVEDIQIVSDRKNIAYKNKYCAICNGIDDYVEWNVELQCIQDDVVANSLGSREESRFDSNDFCMHTSKPPTEYLEKMKKCLRGYEKCNETGLWQNSDENIEEACGLYSLPYTHLSEYDPYPINYRNIHCYLCNVLEEYESVNVICPLSEYQDFRGVTDVSFTAMFNLKISSMTSDNSHAIQCLRDEIYDVHFNVCRKLYCPLLYMPVHGTCVEKYLNSTGYTLALTVTLRPKPDFDDMVSDKHNGPNSNLELPPPPPPPPYNFTDESQIMALISALNKAMKLSKSKCGLCGTKLYKADDLSYIVMIITYTTKKCNTATILNLAETFQYSPPDDISILSTSQLDTRLHFQPELTFDFQTWDEISMNDMMNTFAVPKRMCSQHFVLKETINCPRIKLNQSEFEVFVRKTNFNGNVLNVNYRTGKITGKTNEEPTNLQVVFDVCVDAYKHASSAASTYNGHAWGVVIFAWFRFII